MILTIKNDGGLQVLSIEVLGKENVEDWLDTNILFNYKGFSANFRIYLMIYSFTSFREQLIKLNDNLSGTASFRTLEENLDLDLTTDGLGHIIISGILRHPPEHDLKMSFSFNSDQTFLASMISECDEILDRHQVN